MIHIIILILVNYVSTMRIPINRLTKSSNSPLILPISSIEHSDHQLNKIVDFIKNDKCGVIPTENCYSFVTSINSKIGINKLLNLKGFHDENKTQFIICKDISMISQYTSLNNNKIFKLLKRIFPGPYTVIMNSSTEISKLITKNILHHHKNLKRKEIGVLIPNDEVTKYIMNKLDYPLLCSSVSESEEEIISIIGSIASEEYIVDSKMKSLSNIIDDQNSENINPNHITELLNCKWIKEIDFIVENGSIVKQFVNDFNTIIDLTKGDEPIILQQGKGNVTFS